MEDAVIFYKALELLAGALVEKGSYCCAGHSCDQDYSDYYVCRECIKRHFITTAKNELAKEG